MLPSGPTLRHVLVIGVDGVRFDLLGPAVTPVIWGFGRDGFLGPVPIDEATPTWSGPCWATIAIGCGVDGHGITGNDLTGHRLADHPDFVTLATRAGLPTLLAVSGWPPLALPEDGGPLFAEATRREFAAVPAASLAWDSAGDDGPASWDAADEVITRCAAAILADSLAGRLTHSPAWLGVGRPVISMDGRPSRSTQAPHGPPSGLTSSGSRVPSMVSAGW